MNAAALDALDELILGWTGRLKNGENSLWLLGSCLVKLPVPEGLTLGQQRLVALLRSELSAEEVAAFPRLIQARRVILRQRQSIDLSTTLFNSAADAHAKRVRERQERNQLEEAERLAEEARQRQLLGRVERWLDQDFLGAERLFAADPDREVLSDAEFQSLRVGFVQKWAQAAMHLRLDDEQAAAAGATNGDIRVVARAGSGKTRVLVTRAAFLLKHCGVSPRQMLLLAFNKDATTEIRTRLSEVCGAELPHVMTFHSLAYALVHPTEDLIYDDVPVDHFGRSREVQEVIDEHIRSREHRDAVRDLMLSYFREDWEHIADGRIELSIDEFLDYRRALPRETLDGQYVKSLGERTIANALFEHDIPYGYERKRRWNGVYSPDFTIDLGPGRPRVVIEYLGLEGEPEYDRMSEAKRAYWATQQGWVLLEYTPTDLIEHGLAGFVTRLITQLAGLGVKGRRRSDEEIWEAVRKRAVDRFTLSVTTFVGRCRKRDLSGAQLEALVRMHVPGSSGEALFLSVASSVYRGYLARLRQRSLEDFDGLLWRAVSHVRSENTTFTRNKGREQGDLRGIRWVLIDEFQDFSPMFFALTEAIRKVSPLASFFCVGDDWQAINAFAGADLTYFRDFPRLFQETRTLEISTNYRSAPGVVKLGNAVMHGRGPSARWSRPDDAWVMYCDLSTFRPAPIEEDRHRGDEITPAVLRIARDMISRGLQVALLARQRRLPWYVHHRRGRSAHSDELQTFVENLRSFLPEEDRDRIRASTVHGFKGLETDGIIVLDALAGWYPLIHPAWMFLRVFGDSVDSLVDEERRLFYVALTRGRRALAIVTESGRVSPFLEATETLERVERLQWSALQPVPSLDGARLDIRVHDAYDVRDQLKKVGYRFIHDGSFWRKHVLAEAFSFEALLEEPWASSPCRILVYREDGTLVHYRNDTPDRQ